jgi:hypothetical protein
VKDVDALPKALRRVKPKFFQRDPNTLPLGMSAVGSGGSILVA